MSLEQIGSDIQEIMSRLSALEENQKRGVTVKRESESLVDEVEVDESTSEVGDSGKKRFKGLQGTVVPQKEESLTTIQSPNLKWEYEALRDSLVKVVLPPEYRINDPKAGINSKDKEVAAILGRSGRFVETGLKIVSEVQKSWNQDNQSTGVLVDNLLLSLTAHMRYIQEEYTSLQVGGQYGNQTKQVFKSLQRNTSNLNPEGIENLKTALLHNPQ